MKITSFVGKMAMFAGMCFLCTTGLASADTTLTPNYVLKSKGVDTHNMQIIAISPDNHYLFAKSRAIPDRKSKKFVHNVHIMNIDHDGSIGRVRTYPMEGVADIEQACFTPDSSAIVFTTKNGSKFIKVDCQSGKTETIMEHIKGEGGFRLDPPVMSLSQNKIIALGHFYDNEDYATPNLITVLDADKKGIEAFASDARDISHVQDALLRGSSSCEVFPRLDVGFINVNYSDHCDMFSWDGDRGAKLFETCKALIGFWGSDTKMIYSAQVADGTYELCIYDAKTDEKTVIEEGRAKPYQYVFLSSDGQTAIFNEDDNNNARSIVYKAKASDGWKIQPVKGLERRANSGKERISYDGTKMVIFNPEGIRVADL